MVQTFRKDPLSYKPKDEVEGRYRITGTLGRGGFGAVYAAEHMGTEQPVALKVLSIDPTTSEDDVVQRFLREARITARLRSHHTVRVFDVGEIRDGPMYMVMELLKGPELEKVLRAYKKAGKTMAEPEAAELGVQVLKSLGEAHRNSLVHRDLKPANIMLADMGEDEPVVKVLDFGIARTEDSSLTGDGKALGTPAYMSPEQCMGKDVDGRSDLYGLGVILFRCITGRLPFEARNSLALLGMHLHQAPPDPRELNPEVSEAMAACILKALSKEPTARFADAREMRQALQVIMGGAWAETPAVPLDALPVEDPITGAGAGPLMTPRPLTAPSLSAVLCVDGEDLMAEATVALAALTADGGAREADSQRGPDAATRVAEAVDLHDSATRIAPSASLKAAKEGSSAEESDAGSGGVDAVKTRKKPVAVIARLAAMLVLCGVAFAVLGGQRAEGVAARSASGESAQRTPTAPEAARAAPASNEHTTGTAAAAVVAHSAEGNTQDTSKQRSAQKIKAKAQAQLADAAKDLASKVRYLREAARLDPTNPTYAGLLKTLSEALAKERVAAESAKPPVQAEAAGVVAAKPSVQAAPATPKAVPKRVIAKKRVKARAAAKAPKRAVKKKRPRPTPATEGDSGALQIQPLD